MKIKNLINVVQKVVKTIVETVASSAAKASTDYKAQVAAKNIEAQANLVQYQRQAMREKPVVQLNATQIEWLVNQAYCGFPQGFSNMPLDGSQAEYVFLHMLKQHSLDAQSSNELAEAIAPLVGIPTLIEPIYKAHELVGQLLVLPYINHGQPGDFQIPYADIVNNPLYEGTPQGVKLKYNLHSADRCKNFCAEYKKSRQYVAEIQNKLRNAGIEINHVRANGIFLEVYLSK